MRLPTRAVATVAIAAIAIFVPTMPAAPAGTPARGEGVTGEAWEAGVQRLLDARAAAVRDRDRAAFLATVDPSAPESFRSRQATTFDGLASVPFSSYDLALRTADVYDLSTAVARQVSADEVRLPLVEERLRIEGVDAVDAVSDMWWTFTRRGDDWYVNFDGDVADLGLLSQRHLWDFGPVEFIDGPREVVMAPSTAVERARALLEITEEGFDRLRESLDWEAPPKVLVIVPASVDQLEEMLQTNFDLSNFVAFAAADVQRDGESGWDWTSPRVYAQEANLARHGRDFQVETLHHELVHAVAFAKAGPFVPNWLHEGHADWLALGRPRTSAVANSDGRLPLDHQFVTGDRNSILQSYEESTSAAAFLAERAGLDAPSRLFDVLGARRIVPGTWRYHLDDALTTVAGIDLDGFERAWNGGRG